MPTTVWVLLQLEVPKHHPMQTNVSCVKKSKNPIWSANIHCEISLHKLFKCFKLNSESYGCLDATPIKVSDWIRVENINKQIKR
jgi:hypothetical protein